MNHFSNKLIVKDPFEMPAVDDTTVLVLRECADLVPHCWIWNESVGYLEVVTYSGYDIYVTVKNVGMKENATSGTIFPSCMEFLITAPNATPIIDNTVTCLRADFKCPTVGQEALMSVDSTSAIRVGDIIIVDTRYQYLVTEIINEHTMKVLNEEKGKEGGVIDVKCNECVPVKILESTHCCEALQDQVDDIYNRIDTKKSIIPDADSLISVTNGSNSLTDAFNDVVLDVDIDLSKYDNSVSKFTSLRYFKETTSGVDAFFSPDRSTGYTNYDLGTNTNYFNNAYINKLQGGQGRSSFISFPIDGSDTMYSNGTAFSYNAHAFYSGGKKLVAFAHDQAEFSTKILPTSTSTYDLGGSTATWNNIYTDSITLNGTTYTSIPTVNDAQLTIYESDGVTPFVTFTANAASNVTATLPASGTNLIYFKELYDTALTTARFVPNTNSVATSYSLGNSNNWINESYIENTRVKTLIGQNYTDGITYPSSNSIGHTVIYDAGTISQTRGKHEFRTGGNTVLTINEIGETVVYGNIVPAVNNSSLVGVAGNSFAEGNINDLYSISTHTTTLDINNVTHSEVANIIVQTANFDFSNIVGVSNLHGSNHTISTDTISISNSYSHTISCLIDVDMLITRLRIAQNSGSDQTDVQFFGYIEIINMTTSTTNTATVSEWYAGRVLNAGVGGNGWYELCPTFTYTNKINLAANTSYKIRAYALLRFPGGSSNVVAKLSGGVSQHGYLRIAMIVQ